MRYLTQNNYYSVQLLSKNFTFLVHHRLLGDLLYHYCMMDGAIFFWGRLVRHPHWRINSLGGLILKLSPTFRDGCQPPVPGWSWRAGVLSLHSPQQLVPKSGAFSTWRQHSAHPAKKGIIKTTARSYAWGNKLTAQWGGTRGRIIRKKQNKYNIGHGQMAKRIGWD